MTRQRKLADFTRDPAFAGYPNGVPFHGDRYLMDYISKYVEAGDAFIETGTCWADTFYYIADNFRDRICISCEPDDTRYNTTKDLFPEMSHVKHLNITSLEMLEMIDKEMSDLKDKKCVFWLDAHGEWWENGQTMFSWPLREEVDYIVKNFKNYAIFIDDFVNPFNPAAKYDVYQQGQKICGPDEVLPVIGNAKLWHLQYSRVTSIIQPFIVGVGLITDTNPLPTDNDMTLLLTPGQTSAIL